MITTIGKRKPERRAPEPVCGKYHRVMADGAQGFLTVQCDLPKDHIPTNQHAWVHIWTEPA